MIINTVIRNLSTINRLVVISKQSNDIEDQSNIISRLSAFPKKRPNQRHPLPKSKKYLQYKMNKTYFMLIRFHRLRDIERKLKKMRIIFELSQN